MKVVRNIILLVFDFHVNTFIPKEDLLYLVDRQKITHFAVLCRAWNHHYYPTFLKTFPNRTCFDSPRTPY